MTERAAKPRRFSKRMLRAWAWIAGALAFFTPWAVLGASPRPVASAAPAKTARRVIIVRKITRRVIIQDAPKAQPVRTIYVGGGSTSSGSSSSSGGSAPPPPATTTSGGSAPP